jgi:hypothetical protein
MASCLVSSDVAWKNGADGGSDGGGTGAREQPDDTPRITIVIDLHQMFLGIIGFSSWALSLRLHRRVQHIPQVPPDSRIVLLVHFRKSDPKIVSGHPGNPSV